MELVARQRQLPVLHFAHGGRAYDPHLILTFERGNFRKPPLEIPFADLGLAPTPDGGRGYKPPPGSSRDPARDATLHPALRDEIRRLCAGDLAPDEPLWLHFDPSAGVTAVLWERWLQPLLHCPILRLPYLMRQPANIGDQLDVVICTSVPEAKGAFAPAELISGVMDELAATGLRLSCHVFVDQKEYDDVSGRLHEHVASGRAVVYAPPDAATYGTAERVRGIPQSSAIASPWLRWMLDELPPVAIDLALFLCHGYYSAYRGSLSFAESPVHSEDRYWARFVGGRELITFLDHCGAASLGLLSPPDNFSLSGTWALADEVARERPGPVLATDLEEPTGRTTLDGLFAFLYAGRPEALPASPALSLYCHPDLLETSHSLAEASHDFETSAPELTMASPAGPTLSGEGEVGPASTGMQVAPPAAGGPVPRWASAGQRILEKQAAEIDQLRTRDRLGSETAQATLAGKERAQKFIADLLKRSLDSGVV